MDGENCCGDQRLSDHLSAETVRDKTGDMVAAAELLTSSSAELSKNLGPARPSGSLQHGELSSGGLQVGETNNSLHPGDISSAQPEEGSGILQPEELSSRLHPGDSSSCLHPIVLSGSLYSGELSTSPCPEERAGSRLQPGDRTTSLQSAELSSSLHSDEPLWNGGGR